MGIEKTITIQEVFYRRRSWWIALIKALLISWLGCVLYRQVVADASSTGVWRHLAGMWPRVWPWLSVAAALMPLNWWLEAQKWRCLMRVDAPLNRRQAWGGVLAGISFSQLTPNRIGEYGGRLAVLKSGQYGAGVAASLVGSLAQWLALFSGGLAGMLYFDKPTALWHSITMIAAIALPVLAAIYFAGARLAAALPLRVLARFVALQACRRDVLWRALAIAFARYIVYVIQYALLINAFQPDIPGDIAVSGIAATFLFQTGIPLPPIAAVLTRGELAQWIWSEYNVHTLSILTASFALFIINLGVPALLGAAVIVRTKVFKSIENEERKHD